MKTHFTSGRWLWTCGVFLALEAVVGGIYYLLGLPENVSILGIALILADPLWFDWRIANVGDSNRNGRAPGR